MVDVVPSAARAPTDEQLPDAVGETSPNEARPTPAEGEPKDAVLTAVTQGNDNVPADHASLNEPPASMDTNMSDSGPGNVTEQPDEQQRRLFDEPPAPGDSAASGEESDVSASMSTDSSADSPDVHSSGVQGDGRESDGAAQPENVSVLPGAERSDGESERSQSMEMGSSQPSPGLPDEPTGAHGDDGVAATAGGSPHQSLDAAANMTLPQTAGRPARVEVETVPPAGPFTATNRMQKDSSDESRKGSTFTPYVSPLRYFRAYRFHPEFTANVPGGFRSATYSNNIDIRKEVCPEELAGRECSLGETCRYQHFSSMAVKGESSPRRPSR